MKYERIVSGRFLSRPNRFIAYAEINGQNETVHVKNTGRCRELLTPGCTIFLAEASNPARKTRYDLIAVEKQNSSGEKLLINMDSQAPNAAAEEWLKKGLLFSENAVIKREVTWGRSRFDFYIEDGKRRAFLEVKGVTLEDSGIAMFPDAPTERGIKHIGELAMCIDDGFEAYVLFVIQMKGAVEFRPNANTHPEFADALLYAEHSGVHILAYDCIVTPDSMEIDSPVNIRLI